jgi:hypothetical protein
MSSKLSPKQCAVILIRDWVTGGGTNPQFLDREQMCDVLEHNVTESKYEKIVSQIVKIIDPFEERIENLYSKIPEVD